MLSQPSKSVILNNYISGLNLSPAGGDNIMPIAIGQVTDSTNTLMYNLTTAMTKTTAAWAVGSGNGGLDEGTVSNNTWYHWYLIYRPDTTIVDALYSLSSDNKGIVTISMATPAVVTWVDHGQKAGAGIVFNTTGALLTGLTVGTRYYVSSTGLTKDTFQLSATQGGASINTSGTQSGIHSIVAPPMLPSNYTYYRRIGTGLIDGSAHWTKIIQDGDYFEYDVVPPIIAASNPGTSAGVQSLAVPTGINVKAVIHISLTVGAVGSALLLSDLTITDTAPGTSVAPLTQIVSDLANGTIAGQVMVRTNTWGQIRSRLTSSDASTVNRFQAVAWYDKRGKN
jgi:hypothetical protein